MYTNSWLVCLLLGQLGISIRPEAYRASAIEGIFKTTAELGEGLAKGLDDFRNKKLFEFGFNQPESVERRLTPARCSN